ncbi:phage tail protein [Marinimicrobium sp. ARAG 43.8]|uniref:phage tail protein n=1 Tax=Marinimicrobium sp. ARAG 43.8 TaxID=3418719 RepID=UPI003CEA833E
MMMTLGFFVFEIHTAPYQQLQRQTEWRHNSQNRVGQRPAYQYLGPGEDTITLSGTLYPELTGGRLSLDLIRTMGDQGKAWPLIEGSGRLYGFWAVTSVSETSSEFFRDGVPKKIEFSIALTRVDEKRLDLLGTATNAGLLAASGLLAAPLNRARDTLSGALEQVTRL